MENKKNNWFLWAGLAIPVIALIIVSIMAYTPNTLTAKYDFLYYFRDYSNYYCIPNGEVFTVKNQQVVIASTTVLVKGSECRYDLETDPPKIYRYDVVANKSEPLSLSEAQKLKIDNNIISSDNITVQRGDYRNMGIFEIFGSNYNNYNVMYLKNSKNELRKIDLTTGQNYNFIFIGWVLK